MQASKENGTITAIAAEFGLDRIALKKFLQKMQKQKAPKETPPKEPDKVQHERKGRGPSKETLLIKEQVLQAIAAGKRTSQDISTSLPGVTPPQVFAALRALELENRIVKIGVILREGSRGKKPAVWSIERRGKTKE